VNEISVKIDEDPRACYFKQVLNAKYIRMALILTLLKDAEGKESRPEPVLTKRPGGEKLLVNQHRCSNDKCITVTEQELDQLCRLMDKEHGIYRCAYCDKKIREEDE
jgi:aspartate carbamoyltransferase catalytic subunit